MPEIIVNEIAVPYKSLSSGHDGEFIAVALSRLRGVGINCSRAAIFRRAVDARHSGSIKIVCSVIATVEALPPSETLAAIHAVSAAEEYSPPRGMPPRGMPPRGMPPRGMPPRGMPPRGMPPCEDEWVDNSPVEEGSAARPIVVGFGPAGMFAALLLAEAGLRPIVIERGDPVARRVDKVAEFYKTGVLDPESNIQFGAGGAGTFSDGKLVTRISDPRTRYVLRRLVEFGAPDDCLINAKPHVGTDLLRAVVENTERRITACGGEVRYRTRFERLIPHGMATSGGDIAASAVVLAIGHSARDTYQYLRGVVAMRAKEFSVGVRIEHLTEDIDRAVYGGADMELLKRAGIGHAEYNLSHRESHREGGRGVYSFCMCPGGEVVAAASEVGGVVTNGMSYRGRADKNSNSALAVSVLPSDLLGGGDGVLHSIDFVRSLERRAYELGGGGYFAPVQTVGDFMDGTGGSFPRRVKPSYMGGERYRLARLDEALPPPIRDMLRVGLDKFARQIDGFAARDIPLTGFETRTSSPVRILRGEDMRAELNPVDGSVIKDAPRVYPCGEGAGYAGGITSAAVDGIKVAEAIIAASARTTTV